MARKKIKHKFKTRIRDSKRYMICRNSIEDKSYWGWEHLKNRPRCQHWSEVSPEITAVLCWRCTHSTVPPPEIKGGYVSKGRMRGWQFMKEFVDKQGNVFHKGKEQPKLKGTLKPTKVNPPKKRKKLTADEKLFKQAAKYKKKLKVKRRQKKK